MKTKGVIVISVLAVTLCLGAFAAIRWVEDTARQVVVEQLSSPQHGVTLSYDQLEISALRLQMTLSNVKAQVKLSAFNKADITADNLFISIKPDFMKQTVALSRVSFSNLKLSGSATFSATSLTVDGPAYTPSPSSEGFSPLGLLFNKASVNNLALEVNSQQVSVAELSTTALQNGVLHSVSGKRTLLKLNEEDALRVEQLAMTDVRLPLLIGSTGNELSELISWSAATSRVQLDGVALTEQDKSAVALAQLVFEGMPQKPAPVQPLLLSTTGMVLSPENSTHPFLQMLAKLGYSNVPLDFKVDASVDVSNDALVLKSLSLNAPEAFVLALDIDVRNVAKAWLAGDVQSVFKVMTGARLASAKIIARDLGLLQRFVKQQSTELQVEPEVYVEMRIRALRPLQVEGGDGERRLGQVYKAVSSFLLNPGEITIEMSPSKPLNWFELFVGFRGLPDFLDRLKVTAINRQIPAKN